MVRRSSDHQFPVFVIEVDIAIRRGATKSGRVGIVVLSPVARSISFSQCMIGSLRDRRTSVPQGVLGREHPLRKANFANR